MISKEILVQQIPHTLYRTDFPSLGTRYQGKVRDMYHRDHEIILITTDRVSAFDRVLSTLPFKGRLLTELACHWFDLTKHIIANHVLSHPDPNVIVIRRLNPVRVEMVVRAYLTGSLFREYQKGGRRMYGIDFKDGMKENESFPVPIITPTSKETEIDSKTGTTPHDRPLSRDEILASGLVSEEIYTQMESAALALFNFGSIRASQQGLILVDTKYEFGLSDDGKLYLIDEIHTQDSSRYWWRDQYEVCFKGGKPQVQLDKEWIRQWLLQQNFSGDGKPPKIPDDVKVEAMERYIQSFEAITGQPFNVEVEDTLARVTRNLHKAAYLPVSQGGSF